MEKGKDLETYGFEDLWLALCGRLGIGPLGASHSGKEEMECGEKRGEARDERGKAGGGGEMRKVAGKVVEVQTVG